MSDELPRELQPEDLPDDPEVLKRLVCDLYTIVVASDELIEAAEGTPSAGDRDLGWLTEHIDPDAPDDHGSLE